MRKRLLLTACVLVLGAALYQLLTLYPGFVLVSIGPYVIETGLLTALVVIVALWWLWRLLRWVYGLIFLPGSWLTWRQGRRQHKHRTQTLQGIIDYMEGNWPKAVNNLKRSVRQSDMPAVNYLGAAAASFQLGDYEAVNTFLHQAEASGEADSFTTGLLRARLQLQMADFARALPLIETLHRKEPTHPAVLRLLASARKGLRDWHGLESLLPDLKKHQVLTVREMEALEEEIYSELIAAFPGKELRNASLAELQQALDRLWDAVPRRLQQHMRLLVQYVEQLKKVGRVDRAESRLRRYLAKNWDEQLVAVYGEINSNVGKQLATAEGWLESHGQSAALLRTLGRLSLKAELWGKARDYFRQALEISKEPHIYLDLAQLSANLGDTNASLGFYRDGLALAISDAHSGHGKV